MHLYVNQPCLFIPNDISFSQTALWLSNEDTNLTALFTDLGLL